MTLYSYAIILQVQNYLVLQMYSSCCGQQNNSCVFLQVRNTIPSISAVTGVTPQRYIWRVCIALHSTPRFAIGFIYYHYYMRSLTAATSRAYRALVRLLFFVYTVENSCLVGVTYIANVENYRKYWCHCFCCILCENYYFSDLLMLIILRVETYLSCKTML